MQKLKTYSLRTQSSKLLCVKPGVGQNIAMHVSPTAKDFFLELICTFLVHSPSFFFQNLSQGVAVLAVANAGFCMGLQYETGHPAYHHRRLMQVPMFSVRGM